MKYIYTVFFALLLLLPSCNSTRRQRRAIPREKAGKETVFRLDELILFYNNAQGYMYVDLMYLKDADTFIFNFTNTEDPTVVMERARLVSGDTTSDMVKLKREQPPKKTSRKKKSESDTTTDTKKKPVLKPVPTENLFKAEKTALEALFTKDTISVIILEGKKDDKTISYRLDFDKSDIISIQNFYQLLTADDKKVRMNNK